MKEIAFFDTRVEAEMWCVMLKEHDIPYVIQANDYGGMNSLVGMINGVRVFVADDKVDLAKNLLGNTGKQYP